MQAFEQNSKPNSNGLEEETLKLLIRPQHANAGVLPRFVSMFCGFFHERANRSRRSTSSKRWCMGDGYQKNT